jgi:hypothetical protein
MLSGYFFIELIQSFDIFYLLLGLHVRCIEQLQLITLLKEDDFSLLKRALNKLALQYAQ